MGKTNERFTHPLLLVHRRVSHSSCKLCKLFIYALGVLQQQRKVSRIDPRKIQNDPSNHQQRTAV